MAGSNLRDRILPTIIAGTRNPEKVEALMAVLEGMARLVPPPLDISHEIEEEGDEAGETVEAIAAGKASAWSRRLGAAGREDLVVGSDGGLLLPALGNDWNPVRTRRFAGVGKDARARADALIALTDHLEGDQRRIGWREAVAFAQHGKVVATFVAESVPGLLARDYDPAVVVANGFWVPALWICPEFGGRRLAELMPEERAKRDDHWSRLRRQVRQAFSDMPRA